jgi:hypothetical protein
MTQTRLGSEVVRIGGTVMTWSGILGKTAAGFGAAAVPVMFAVAGAGQASADICVSGPWGYASACLNTPGWVDWNPGWDGGWHGDWHGGDWEGDD